MRNSIDIFEAVLSIGTVAEKIGVSVQTLRLYEQEGLILPHKTKTGRRSYSFSDIDRLQCIRKMIKEHGLNLNGVRRLLSLVPCWNYKGGIDNDCKSCPAFYEAVEPCWNIKNVGAKCQNVDCRACPVYQLEITCDNLKEIIYQHLEF